MSEDKYDYEAAQSAYLALESDLVLEMLDESQRYVLTKRLSCQEYKMFQRLVGLLDPHQVEQILRGEGFGDKEIRQFIEGNM